MKKLLATLLILFIGLYANAKPQANNMPEEQIIQMNKTLDSLTKKIYSGALFSPSDCSTLIGIKIKLDDAMLVQPETQFANLYFKLGKIYQKREKNQEAIECYQTIVENFSDTALAPKAVYQLKQMGINIKLNKKTIDENEE